MKVRDTIILLILGMALGGCLAIWGQSIKSKVDDIQTSETAEVKWRQDHFKLNESNLYDELLAQGVLFPEIVQAQAILETGHFKSHACIERNNLFGLRNSNGTYMYFAHWTDAVASYKKYIQSWEVPPNDYYQYLDSLGYAEDKLYIKKLKEVVNHRKR